MKTKLKSERMNRIINILVIFYCLFFSSQMYATHIVGGSLTYKKGASNQSYIIKLSLRRDCFFGDPEAFFDSPASVGIFDATGKLMTNLGTKGQLLMKYQGNQTINDPITESLCSIDGRNTVCFHQADYEESISLPIQEGGYYLMYQRCCRNLPLQNISDPLDAGGSWVVHIANDVQNQINSTPVFKGWSQIFLCAGMEYNFDQSAYDEEGDSLVYKLWTPYLGASKAFPKPQPPASPDFNPVKWVSPYSESNMLGGNSPLTIDNKTGKLKAIPNTLGQFLIGVRVEEYRNGLLLSTVYRDFEVKVLDCGNLVDAKIIAPKLQCENLTVNFKNENLNAKSVKWFFDFDRNKNAVSNVENPTYKYTDTGTYKVALVVTKDSTCFDTAFHTITLKKNITVADFDVKMSDCVNGTLTLTLTDRSKLVPVNANYKWTISYNGKIINSTQKNVTLPITNGVLTTVKLEISEDGDGCMVESIPKIFTTSFLKPEFHLDSKVVCVGDSTRINFIIADSVKGRYNYVWDSHPSIIAGRNTSEPTVLSTSTQNYYLYVNVDNKNGCTSRDSILIQAKPKSKLDFTVENALGSLSAKFINKSDPLSTYAWDFGVPNVSNDTASTRDAAYTYPSKGTYIIKLCTQDGCAPCIQKSVTIGGDAILITDTINACIGQTIAINRKIDSKYSYKWSPADKVSDSNIPNPTFRVDSARIITARLFDAGTGVEVGTQTVVVRTPVTDIVKNIPDTIAACAGKPTGLNPKADPSLMYQWSPVTGLDNANAPNPQATVNGTTTYTVRITNPKDSCTLTDRIVVIIPSKIALDLIPDSLDACNGVPIHLNPNGKSDPNLKYKWTPGSFLDDSTALNPKATINTPTIFTVMITDVRFADCSVMKSVKINIPLVKELGTIPDSVLVCAGVASGLNPNGNSKFKYEWSPASGLDNPTIANPKVTVNATTIYIAKITDTQNGNCTLNKTVKVKVPPAFTVEPTFKDSTSCLVSTFKVGVKSNNPLVKFEWFDGNTSISKTDTITLRPFTKTTYRVVGTDENGCQKSENVTVDPARIIADAIAPNNGRLCQGDSARLTVNLTGSFQNVRYEWTPVDQIVSGANTASPVIKPNTSVLYTLKVTNAQGCISTDTVTVRVLPVTQVTASANPVSITIGQSSQISSTGVPGYTYKWSPIDGLDNPNSPNPKATPKQTTTYTLTVTTPDGCVQTRSVTITVIIPECAEPFIFLPNAFTPNDDGKNDEWCLRSNIVASMTLIVFDRWGEKVFETRNQSTCWDGRHKGKLLNPDVYGFYLTVNCVNGQKFTKKGNVTILR